VSAVLEGHNDRAVGWYLRYVEVRSPNGKVGFTRDVTKAHLFTSIDEAVGYVGRTTSARRPSGMRHRPGRAYAYVVEPVLECLNV